MVGNAHLHLPIILINFITMSTGFSSPGNNIKSTYIVLNQLCKSIIIIARCRL